MKIVNFFINFLKSYTFIILGVSIFVFFVWVRFIRERTPKDIPFTLSTLGFILLIEICIVYFYIILHTISSKESNFLFEYIVKQFYTPLESFDYYWKHLPWVNNPYIIFMDWFTLKLEFFIIKYPIFYLIFYFLPRFILVTALTVDVFYFHKLFFIYKILLIGILLFLRRYIIYSIKMYKKDLILFLEQDLLGIDTPYVFGIMPSEWPENYDPEDPDESEEVPFGAMMGLSINIFIDYYIENYMYKNNIIEYRIGLYQNTYYEKISIRYNIPHKGGRHIAEDIPFSIYAIIDNEMTEKLEKILYLAILLENYNIFANKNIIVKYIKTFIFLVYLTCWSYILIKSASIENVIDTFILIQKIVFCQAEDIENPDTGMFL